MFLCIEFSRSCWWRLIDAKHGNHETGKCGGSLTWRHPRAAHVASTKIPGKQESHCSLSPKVVCSCALPRTPLSNHVAALGPEERTPGLALLARSLAPLVIPTSLSGGLVAAMRCRAITSSPDVVVEPSAAQGMLVDHALNGQDHPTVDDDDIVSGPRTKDPNSG